MKIFNSLIANWKSSIRQIPIKWWIGFALRNFQMEANEFNWAESIDKYTSMKRMKTVIMMFAIC